MTQHIREVFMDALVTALKRIVTDTSVTWAMDESPDVSKLSRSALSRVDFPFIMVAIQGETTIDRSNSGRTRVQDSSMNVILDCWIESDETGEEVSKILHDVEKVFGLDPQFGGTCRDTMVTGNQTIIADELEGRAAVLVSVEVRYGHLDTDPSTLR